MSNHLRRIGVALVLGAATAGAGAAADLEPSPGAGQAGLQQHRMFTEGERYGASARAPRSVGRPVNGGPGYVGSDYGLGKPAFTGLGSRPDWGFSE
jgi:hypothetical protein